MLNLLVASFDFTNANTFPSAVSSFLTDRFPLWSWIYAAWSWFAEALSQPHILAIILAWAFTFTVVMTLLIMLGFGPGGVIAGSLAAAFQSWMYGGFTPAAGIFATLTSVCMLGYAMPAFAVIAAIAATGVAGIVWACGVGK